VTDREHIDFWLKSAASDLETAQTLFDNQRYEWCLFIGHLIIEKALKAIFVKDNPDKNVPLIHNLAKLAEQTKLRLKDEQKLFLLEINQFNIRARYPDYDFEFYRKCTPEYTEKYFSKIKEFHQWLLRQAQNKRSSD